VITKFRDTICTQLNVRQGKGGRHGSYHTVASGRQEKKGGWSENCGKEGGEGNVVHPGELQIREGGGKGFLKIWLPQIQQNPSFSKTKRSKKWGQDSKSASR